MCVLGYHPPVVLAGEEEAHGALQELAVGRGEVKVLVEDALSLVAGGL